MDVGVCMYCTYVQLTKLHTYMNIIRTYTIHTRIVSVCEYTHTHTLETHT